MNTVLVVLFVLSNTAARAAAPTPVRVGGPGYEGAIVSAEALLTSNLGHMSKAASLWTPTEADIREAEAQLPDYLKSPEAAAVVRGSRIGAELTRYYRQYWGIVVSGQRRVFIQFFHADSSVGKRGLWHQRAIVVSGGGHQFFRVSYDVGTKRFSGLQVNAPE